MADLKKLTDPALTIIFATSPTGLGHLRVTDALYDGLPKEIAPDLLGAQDPLVSAMYRFVSIHPVTRLLMELTQMSPLDKPYAFCARLIMRSQTKLLYQQLKTILSERVTPPKTVLLVATHNTLGHQLGVIKETLKKEMNINIILVVQVTDDSPQPIWYIYDADAIFVPSIYTKEKLLAYAQKANLRQVPIIVSAYPISPLLTKSLSEEELSERMRQTDPSSSSKIHISLPISGAAVGMGFSSAYIKSLHQVSERYFFHITAREAAYTANFIHAMSHLSYVKLSTSPQDMTTVRNYEHVLTETTVSLEVTKPSEQAFKTLATPQQRGGAILLFSNPVGGQEYDNFHFLRNHELMPSKKESMALWNYAKNQDQVPSDILQRAHHWRALRLPLKPHDAALFTQWALEQKIFSAMMHYTRAQQGAEIQSNGVEQFWQQVVQLLEKKKS